METQAWRSCSFDPPERIPTMISAEEKQYLYWLGALLWTGRGCVVEIGPWLGGSTVCLAAGMRDSGNEARGQLEVFDNFIWRAFMAERADLPLVPGDSFESAFLENTAACREIVRSRRRALPDESIEGDVEAQSKRFSSAEPVPLFDWRSDRRVEILFVDGAKSWRGMRHMLRALADSFLESGSLLVCQDFKYWGTYWVPVMMMRIADFVRPVHDVLGGTTVAFELVRPIPPELLDRLEDHVCRLPTGKTLGAIERAAALLSDAGDRAGAHAVDLGRVSFLAHQGLLADAVAAFRACERAWPTSVPTAALERARAYLREEKRVVAPRPIRLRVSEWSRRGSRRLARWLRSRARLRRSTRASR